MFLITSLQLSSQTGDWQALVHMSGRWISQLLPGHRSNSGMMKHTVIPGNRPAKVVGLYIGILGSYLQDGAHGVCSFTSSKLVSTCFLHGEHAHRETLQLMSSCLVTFTTGGNHQKDFTCLNSKMMSFSVPSALLGKRVCVS